MFGLLSSTKNERRRSSETAFILLIEIHEVRAASRVTRKDVSAVKGPSGNTLYRIAAQNSFWPIIQQTQPSEIRLIRFKNTMQIARPPRFLTTRTTN